MIIGPIPSSRKHGITQQTIVMAMISHVELSQRELYLIPLNFSICNFGYDCICVYAVGKWANGFVFCMEEGGFSVNYITPLSCLNAGFRQA